VNTVLIAVKTTISQGMGGLRLCLRQLKSLEVFGISSVYRKMDKENRGSLNEETVVVIRSQTRHELDEMRALIKKAREIQSGAVCDLLTFNETVDLDPSSPVPHPDLHLDPLVLRCAAEIHPDFVHPVLGRRLQDLVKFLQSLNEKSQFEFLSRGEALLAPVPEA
jgi:2-amino-4-hydroxy-6-hydroxymethyldihydropteridine diphosphokinase